MNNEIIIVQKALEKDILEKLETIKLNVITKSFQDPFMNIEVLAMVNDELSDVILNWDPRVIENDLGDELM
jgi:hypothetical protein